MASPVADSYGCASGGVIAGGRYYVSPFWRDMAQGWNEIVISGAKPPGGITAYSGMAVDVARGELHLIGGGHFDYYGDEVWTLDYENRAQWVQDQLPYFTGYSMSYSGTVESDAAYQYAKTRVDNVNFPGAIVEGGMPIRPISRHTYKSVHWIESLNKMLVGGGSTWSGAAERYWQAPGGVPDVWWNAPYDCWLYDATAKTWGYKGSSRLNPAYDTLGSVSCYHRLRNRVYQIGKDANSRITMREWNPEANTWTLHPGFATGTTIGSATLCADTKRDRILVIHRFSTNPVYLHAWYPETNTWEALTTTGAEPSSLAGDAQICYSPKTDSLLLMRTAADGMQVLDLTTMIWSSVNVPCPNLVQTEGRWFYDYRRGVALLVYRDIGTNIRVFSYKD